MERLKEMLINDMDEYDGRLRELKAVLSMAEYAADATSTETITMIFSHARNCVTNLEAELEDIRGTMKALLTEIKESA